MAANFPSALIREAIPSDAGALAALMNELGYPVAPDVLWSRIERMPPVARRTFVAEIDGEIAGFAGCSAQSIYESDVPICWIMVFSVASRFRRRGVGRALLGEIEHWCRENGISDIKVNSGEHRADAHAFYEACGYLCSGRRFKKSLQS